MGAKTSRLGPSTSQAQTTPNNKKPKKFDYSDMKLMKKYLPSFVYYEMSTEEHRRIAAQHWDRVFKDAPPQRNSSFHTTSSQPKEAKHITKAQNNKITELYDVFYAYLEEHGGDLKQVFRSSMHVRGRVLVHISAGMRTMLAAENIADKILSLTRTHRRFGVKLEHYDCVGRALLHAMERTSGTNWSPEIADAWSRMFSHSSVILIRSQQKSERQVATKDGAYAGKSQAVMAAVGPTSNMVITKSGPYRVNFHDVITSIRSKRDRSKKSATSRSSIEREHGA